MTFVGGERSQLVEDLVSEFAAISEDSGARMIVIEGPTGWGKTRVVQELYERLAVGQNYWPKSIADARSDDPLLNRKRIHPPEVEPPAGEDMEWMWWGIECKLKGTGRPQQVLPDEVTQLVAHHQALIRMAETKELAKSAIISVASFATSILIPSLSDLLAIGQTTKELVEVGRSGLKHDEGGPIDADDVERVDVVKEVLELLEAIDATGTPVVMVIEDAHLADPSLNALIEELMSREKALKVMILCLAWPNEVAAQQSEELDGTFGATLNTIRAQQPERIRSIELDRLGSEDLEEIVFTAAPGTKAEVAKALARRADGNPLVLKSLLEVPRVTMSVTPESGITLSPEEVAQLPQEYKSILQARWDGLPTDVQLALCIAALQGRRFVAELVESSYESVPAGIGSPEAINSAVTPIGWIRELEDHLRFHEQYNFELAAEGSSSFLGPSQATEIQVTLCDKICDWRGSSDWQALPQPTKNLLAEILASTAGSLPPGCLEERSLREADGAAYELAGKWRMIGRSIDALEILKPIQDSLSACGFLTPVQEARGHMRLGVLLGEAGRSGEALSEEQQAVAILSEGLGPMAPDTLAAKGNLSGTLRRLGKLTEALELAREVQQGWNETEGENSARARWSLRHLAMMEQANGNYEAALSQIEHLLNAEGPTVEWIDPDEDRLVILGAQGALLYHLGRPGEAEPVQREALAALLERLPPEDVRVQAARNNLAVTLSEVGKSDEALELVGQVVASRLKTMPANHPDVLSARGNMVAFMSELGRYGEALALSEEILLGYEATYGESHPEYARALGSVAACLRQLDRNPEALPLLVKAVDIAESTMPADHPELARLRRNLERASGQT